jgi:beta-1,2-mannobiose phosphorylase / 1,2-beta-oligomannan phosphorylase
MNLTMLYGDISRRGRPFAKDPAVVSFRGQYLLYYSIPPFGDGRAGNGWAIGIARSSDLDSWQKVGELLPEQEPERNGLCAPGAIVLDGRVHLFYQTYGNGPKDAICHAVSDDSLHFHRNPTNPILAPTGVWNCGRAIDADVIVDGDRLLLYWATRDPAFQVQMLGVSAAPLPSDFGRDRWTQLCDAPILKPELPWERKCVEAPALCRHDGRLFMFYGGGYNNEPQQIGCAVSDDGVHWTRLSDEPILPNGAPGAWNASESGHPFVFTDVDGRMHLFFQGNADMGKTWQLARKGITWIGGKPDLSHGTDETRTGADECG